MTMLKDDLVATLTRRNPHLARRDVETLLDSLIETINEASARGDQVRLTEAGSFSIVEQSPEKAAASRAKRNRGVPSAIADTLDEINDRIESIL